MSMTKYPMIATLIANIINVILNYLFIFGKFGFPELGIVGAAVGTLVSRIIMVFYLWFLLLRNNKTRPYLLDLNFLNLSKDMINKAFQSWFSICNADVF